MKVWRFDLESKRISTDTVPTSGTAAYSDLLTDTLYVVSGATVLGMHMGAKSVGKWRGKPIKLPSGNHLGFAWLRLNGALSEGAVVRLYADGSLFYTTPPIVKRDPVRLPAGRFRSWEIELESKDRITSVAMGSTIGELL